MLLSASQQSETTAYPYLKEQKAVVVLVEFSNESLQTGVGYTDSDWSNKVFGSTGKTVNTYFKEVSDNKISYTPIHETSGIANDGVIRISLEQKHPAVEIFDKSSGVLGEAIFAKIYDELEVIGLSLEEYDTNNNHKIESTELHFIFVIAGEEYSSASLGDTEAEKMEYVKSYNGVWARQFDSYIALHDYAFSSYVIMGEKHVGKDNNGNKEYHTATIGTICHELGHDMGLPDLYDSGKDSGKKYSSNYSLMSSGNWGKIGDEPSGTTPTHLDAYCKIKLGIIPEGKIVTVSEGGTSNSSYELGNFDESNYQVLKITTKYTNKKLNNKNYDEYFLVENRAGKTGTFDESLSYIPDPKYKSGMVVYHINESFNDETGEYIKNNNNEYGDRLVLFDRLCGYYGSALYPDLRIENSKRFNESDEYDKPWFELFSYDGGVTVMKAQHTLADLKTDVYTMNRNGYLSYDSDKIYNGESKIDDDNNKSYWFIKKIEDEDGGPPVYTIAPLNNTAKMLSIDDSGLAIYDYNAMYGITEECKWYIFAEDSGKYILFNTTNIELGYLSFDGTDLSLNQNINNINILWDINRGSTRIIEPGCYSIVNSNLDYALTCNNFGHGNTAGINVFTDTFGEYGQGWYIDFADETSYTIRPMLYNDLELENHLYLAYDGNNGLQMTYTWSDNCKWYIFKSGSGYVIRPYTDAGRQIDIYDKPNYGINNQLRVHSNISDDPSGKGTVQIENQVWKINPISTLAAMEDGTYRVQNFKSGLYMNGERNGNANMTFKQYADKDGNEQIWDIVNTGDGWYTIASAYHPGYYMTAKGGNNVNCTLETAPASGIGDSQKWKIAVDDGHYRFISKAYPGHALAVQAASVDEGTDLVLFEDNRTSNALWIITPKDRKVISDGVYTLFNYKSDMVLTVKGDLVSGSGLMQQYADGLSESSFYIHHVANGYYTVASDSDRSLYLKAVDENTVKLQSNDNAADDSLLWVIIKNNDGSYRLVSKKYPKKAAVVYAASTSAGETVIMFDDNLSSNSKWILHSGKISAFAEGTYRIQNLKSSLYMDGMTKEEFYGSKLFRQDVYKGDNSQVWMITRDESDGYYTMAACYNPGLYVTAMGYNNVLCELQYNTDVNGSNSDAQKWKIVQESDGTYRFVSKAYPGYAMAVLGASIEPQAGLVLFQDNRSANAKWHITPEERRTLPDGIYTFENVNSGHMLDINDSKFDVGLKLMQEELSKASTKQQWFIRYVRDGYCTISSCDGRNLYLKAISNSEVRAVSAEQLDAADDDAMLWAVMKNSDGSCRISPKAYPDYAVVTVGELDIAGAEVILADDNMSYNGWWKLATVKSGMYKIQNSYTGYGIGLSADGQSIVQYGTSATAIPAWYIVPVNGFSEIRITSRGGDIAVGDDGVSIVYNYSGPAGDKSLWFIDADGRIRSKADSKKVLSVKDDIKLDNIPLALTDIGTSQSEIWTFIKAN